MEKEQYIALIINQLKGTTTPEEDQLLSAWLAANDKHQGVKEQVLQDWETALQGRKDIEVDVEKDFQRFQNRMRQSRSTAPKAKVIELNKTRFRWIWAAAAIFLAAGLWWTMRPDPVVGDQVLVTNLGETRTITLSDGTEIWLNENSSLTYPKSFNGSLRMVQLKGEGYFEVAKNAEKPFIVQMNQAEVKVLGTAFNLEESNQEITLTLDEGRVRFSKKDKSKSLLLTTGETGILNLELQTLEKDLGYHRNNASWKTKVLVFQQVKLEEVLSDVENYFGNEVSLENPNLKQCIFGGNFPKPDVNSVLTAIAAAFEMQLSQDRNGNYLLKGGHCK